MTPNKAKLDIIIHTQAYITDLIKESANSLANGEMDIEEHSIAVNTLGQVYNHLQKLKLYLNPDEEIKDPS